MQEPNPPPGFYDDPDGSPVERWWDGTQWTGTTRAPNKASSPWVGIGLAALFGTGAAVSAILTVTSSELSAISPRSLAGLLLGGIITFFFAVAALVAVYHALGLTESQQPDQPLGLPSGSVRAIIALILIFLFFLMAVFLYLDVSQTSTNRILSDLTQDQVDSIAAEDIETIIEREVVVSEPGAEPQVTEIRFDVVLRSTRETSVVAEDIARQLITTIGTLIVAIAAFYFGAGSVAAAKQELRTQPPGTQPPGTQPPGTQPPGVERITTSTTDGKDDQSAEANES